MWSRSCLRLRTWKRTRNEWGRSRYGPVMMVPLPSVSSFGSWHGSVIGSVIGTVRVRVTNERERSVSTSSERQRMALEERILNYLYRTVKDPWSPNHERPLPKHWIRGPYVRSDAFPHRPNSHSHNEDNNNEENNNNESDVHDRIHVAVLLRLPSQLCYTKTPALQERIKECVQHICQNSNDHPTAKFKFSTVKVTVEVEESAPERSTQTKSGPHVSEDLGPGLANVAKVVAVYSCKGGVGKSTVSVNLAYAWAKRGVRVGLLDVDVHGPSLPLLVQPTDPTVRRSTLGEGMVQPILHEGVKILSLGFVSPKSGVPGSGAPSSGSGAAVMRGPMASRVVTQLLKGTEWGELDVLVLDLPPGTGDVPLSVCQEVALDGAVMVTTPSQLSLVDVRKGMEMFTGLFVPTLAVVENMAYFECEGGTKHYPFGRGLGDVTQLISSSLSQQPNSPTVPVPKLIPIPLTERTHEANEAGVPLVLTHSSHTANQNDNHNDQPKPECPEITAFYDLADHVAEALLQSVPHHNDNIDNNDNDNIQNATASLTLALSPSRTTFVVRTFTEQGGTETHLPTEHLRRVHPATGMPLPVAAVPESWTPTRQCGSDRADAVTVTHTHAHTHTHRPPKVSVTRLQRRGHYGYEVEWSDGATVIYSLDCIAHVVRSHDNESPSTV